MAESLENCPSAWYDNCTNALHRCRRCCAGFGSPKDKLQYSPIDLTLNSHPYQPPAPVFKPVNQQISRSVKSGFKRERELTRQIARQTLKSGAILGDGDIHCLDFLRLDSKNREKTRTFSVSWQEYQEGQRQGINGWAVTVQNRHRPETLVCLTMDAYTKLLALAQRNST